MNDNDRIRLPGMRTIAIHAGQEPDSVTGACAPNLVLSNNYLVDPDTPFSARCLENAAPYIYTRWSNPTVAQLETAIAALEGAEAGACFGSGMAAVTALLMHILRPGDHILVGDVTYAGVAELITDMLPKIGIEIGRVNTSDSADVESMIRPTTRLVYIETPCNPILRLTDIRAVADAAHKAGALLAVDSTLATPMSTRPLELGADFVVHSLSKYLGGHGDALGGVVVGDSRTLQDLRKNTGIHLGGVLSPFNAWLILRGIATLPLRMAAHADNAMRLAQALEADSLIQKVIYPGLPSHPQHALARRQMRNFSGMLTFQVQQGREAAHRIAKCLRIFHYAVSLGHHRSLIYYLHTDDLLRSSFCLSKQQERSYRDYANEGIFRVSVGLEDPDDLIAELKSALQQSGC